MMSDNFEDDVTYCVYCYNEVAEWQQVRGCCGEIHFATGKELNEIDRQVVKGSGIVYDPPMSETDQYLLRKEKEEEHKSYDY